VVELLPWMERKWVFGIPVGHFPAILERLRGTPARARELAFASNEDLFKKRVAGKWSAQEHLGHLDDLHELDEARLAAFLARADQLPAADMSNKDTETADHNSRPTADLLERFASRRATLITKLEVLSASDVAAASLHPRLKQQIRLIDWTFFVAEHDDHHLAQARRALRAR
jgi:hypothetical protein